MNAKEIILKHGGEVVDDYDLVNNWGYIFRLGGIKYDARRWANCYGSDCGWGVMRCWGEGEERKTPYSDEVKALERELNDRSANTEW